MLESTSQAMKARSFRIDIPDAQIEDLKRRLHATRLPASIEAEGWHDGALMHVRFRRGSLAVSPGLF